MAILKNKFWTEFDLENKHDRTGLVLVLSSMHSKELSVVLLNNKISIWLPSGLGWHVDIYPNWEILWFMSQLSLLPQMETKSFETIEDIVESIKGTLLLSEELDVNEIRAREIKTTLIWEYWKIPSREWWLSMK